jgi:hypothetical protein
MYTLTLNEVKAVLRASAQAGQSGAMNKTSVETKAQDDYIRDVNRCKRYRAFTG